MQRLRDIRIDLRARVAGRDDDPGCQGLVHRDGRLAAEIPRGARDEFAVSPQHLAHPGPAVDEPPAHDPLEWVEPELEPGCDAEVPARAAKTPEQLAVLLGGRADSRPVREHELRPDEVVAGQSVLGSEVADPSAHCEPADTG